MSGHSKWSKIKHQKASTDAVKGRIFTKMSMAIIIAVKQGGGVSDPDSNFRLRLAIDKARSYNMPRENIERAILRAKGVGKEAEIHDVVYEAYGPLGTGLIIEAVTNNKQRTVADIKNLLDKNGGNLATAGSVSYMFEHVGVIIINRGSSDFDKVMETAINAGASDIAESGSEIEIYTSSSQLHCVKQKISSEYEVLSSELIYKPKNTVPVPDIHAAQRIYSLIERLEENEDVQKVHCNADFPDDFNPAA